MAISTSRSTTHKLPLSSSRSHASSSSSSPTRRHDASGVSQSLPPSLVWKCLQPMEMPLSQDGELSARNTEHRTVDHFEAVVHDSTWLLNQALQASGGGKHSSSFGSKTSNGHIVESESAHASSSVATSAKSNSHNSSSSSGAAGGGDFFPSSKTRRQLAVQSQRAFALFRLQQFARAVKDYDACLVSEPTSALLYYNRGCAFYAWGKKDRAIQDFTRALKLDCKNVLYIESRALVNKELGRFQEAIQDYTWLETLRRMASTGQRRGSQHHGLVVKTTARGSDDDSEGLYRTPASLRGSFSMSFSDLQASLLGAAISGSSSRDTLPNGSLVTDGLTTEQRETHVLEWMVRFLQPSPCDRKHGDIVEAVQYAKCWSFFRGMDTSMVEQCLEDAVYGFYDADAVVVEQDKRASHFVLVLSPTAPFVKNIDSGSGVSKLRELKKLSQGDAVGTDAYAVSFGDGTLRTIKHEIAEATAEATNPMLKIAKTRLRGPHHGNRGSLLALLNSHSLISMLNSSALSPLLHSNQHAGDGDHASSLLLPEPASFTSLEPVHCLLLEVEAYRDILHDHEEAVLEERVAFLRGCRVFQSCSTDVLTALAAVSGARVYDPGKDLLRTGDEVTYLSVIKRGVCQVRKTIRVAAAQARAKPKAKGVGHARSRTAPLLPLHKHGKVSDKDDGDPLSSSRSSGDGSWVLDNGWMLTNPRLVNNAQGNGKGEPMVIQDVDVGILASGQVFGELSVLQPGQSSQVTIHSQTMVEILVFEQSDLARLHVQYHSGTMNALQESLLFHNPPQQKIVQLQRDLEAWDKEKRGVLRELALHLPGKAQSVIQGAACMTQEHKPPKMQPPMRRRASLVSVPPLSPLTRHKSIKLMRGSDSLPGLLQ